MGELSMHSTVRFLKDSQTVLFLLLMLSVLPTGCGGVPFPENEKDGSMISKQEKPGNPYYSRTDTTTLDLPDSVWAKVLTEEVYEVARKKGTEQAFSGKFLDFEGRGTYFCAACGNELFRSDAKFADTCGWPSFFEPVSEKSIFYQPDTSHGLVRTEVICGRCGAHLGHVFDDGPPPTGKRFCMNSIVLDFESDGE
ncbi:MAG: peptide-methionine (R)-S-oxide reductase MsrB [Ignavibacteriaceae bacterium]|nr:peptide-methionine (R)-S-oxide reductase MsrB [Ignavibacteriaceae bacterium]